MRKISSGAATDSIILTFVRIVTALSSMLIYKMMTTCFSVAEYGLYSTAILVSTTVTSFSILGFTDAVNYFYNQEHSENSREIYVNTIFVLQSCIGTFSGLVIIFFRKWIGSYFGSDSVGALLPYIAFIPLLTNVLNMLQVLFISCKKTKVIAIRNFVLSMVKVVFVCVSCYFVKNVSAVLIATLIIDIFSILYTIVYCKKNVFHLNFKKVDMHLCKEILWYSVPMAAYILTNSLSRNIDKIIIGNLGNVEELAIYTIAAKELPFDMLTGSFITVLVPYITRFVANDDYHSAGEAFSKYLQITYTIVWILAVGAIATSKELMLLLYDEKYLMGLNVFIIYLIVDMIKFANVSLIFAVKAKTRELLLYSGSALALNWVLNIVLYKTVGFSGPAIATIIVTSLLSFAMLFRSSRLLKTNTIKLLNIKNAIIVLTECLVSACLIKWLGQAFLPIQNTILRFIIIYGVYAIIVGLLNYKRILKLLKEINSIKMC